MYKRRVYVCVCHAMRSSVPASRSMPSGAPYNHGTATCTTPFGEGASNSVVINVNGQSSSQNANSVFSYDIPVIDAITPSSGKGSCPCSIEHSQVVVFVWRSGACGWLLFRILFCVCMCMSVHTCVCVHICIVQTRANVYTQFHSYL